MTLKLSEYKFKRKKISQSSLFTAVLVSSSFLTSAYGMESDYNYDWPPDKNNVNLGLDNKFLKRNVESSTGASFLQNTYTEKSAKKSQIINPSSSLSEDLLTKAQMQLNQDVLHSTHAIRDSFSPLIHEIRSLCENLPENQKSILNQRFPNLLNPSLSLYPWHLLRAKEKLKTEKFNSLTDHEGFKRIKEVIEILNSFIKDLSSLSCCLENLKGEYKTYLQNIRSSSRHMREIFLSPVFLNGAFLNEKFLISQSTAYALLSMDEHGIPSKKNETGSSPVAHVGQIYAKQTFVKKRETNSRTANFQIGTLDPGMEWGMSAFHRLLFGEGAVPSSLFVLSDVPIEDSLPPEIQERKKSLRDAAQLSNIAALDREALLNELHENKTFKKTQSYALQVTSEVKGELLGTFLENAFKEPKLFETLDKDQVQGLILSQMLTHPADAKGDNFIVTSLNEGGKRHIISIDNDLSFASSIIREKENFHSLGVKNILFCIPKLMNQKIEESVSHKFLAIEPTPFLLTWLKGLNDLNKQYMSLKPFMGEETFELLRLPLKLKAGTGVSLLKRLYGLQRSLNSYKFSTPTLQELFKEMSPLRARYIDRLLKKETSPLKAFHLLYRQEIPFEELFSLEENINGKMVGEILANEGRQKDEYKERTFEIEDSVEEILKNINFKSLSLPQWRALLETAAQNFPQALRASLPHFPSTIYEVLELKPSPSLIHAMIDCPSHSLTSHQLFNVTVKILASSLPQKSFLLEKLLSMKNLDFSQKDKEDNTLLHLWAHFKEPIPQVLFDQWKNQGGDFNALNNTGESSLDIALSTLHLPFIEKILTHEKKLSYYERNLEQFYREIKISKDWKTSSLHALFQTQKARDPHWRWALKRTKLFSSGSEGQEIEILTYNQGRITSEKRILSPDIKKQLWDGCGLFQAYHKNKCREVGRVICDSQNKSQSLIKKAIYFKRFPSLSGMSLAVSHLQETLFGEGFLPLTFAKIRGEPFLISPGIGVLEQDSNKKLFENSNFQSLLKTNSVRLKNLDEDALSQLIILAMLTNPEDGKPSNYALEFIKTRGKERLMGFDEEQAFVPAVSKPPETTFEKLTSIMVQMKSVLFCMDIMDKPMSQKVKEMILNWNEFKLIKDWVTTLQLFDQKMQDLFKNSLSTLFKQHESYIGIPFQTGEITTLLNKVYTIKSYIKSHSTPKLFDLLWQVEPFAAFRYTPILRELKNISAYERFLLIDGGVYEQNQGLFERAFSPKDHMPSSLRSGQILNVRQIPDFESRKDKLGKSGKGFDPKMALEELEEVEGKLAQENLKDFQSQSILQAKTIASLLKREPCFDLSLESFQKIPAPYQRMVLSLLKNQAPHKLQLYYSTEMNTDILKGIILKNLTVLNLKGCENLDESGINLLNNLTLLRTLNLSRNSSIRSFGLSDKPYHYPSLEILHLGKCERLQKIHCEAPKITSIRASFNPSLTEIELKTPHLEVLDLRNNKRLELETALKFARKITSLKELSIENCESIPLKSLKIPLQESYVDELLRYLKNEKAPYNQHKIGYMYHHGQGVKQDYEEALTWYQKAADQGNAMSYNNIGYMYALGQGVNQDYEKALDYYQRGAEKGNVNCLNAIGALYHSGLGVPQDLSKAREYFQEAAQRGHAGAQYNLGCMYEFGEGVPQDYAKALACYEKAVEKDEWHRSNIQYRIAYLYDRELGGIKNPAKSQKLYQKTFEIALEKARTGNSAAYGTLGNLYLRGKGIKQDKRCAFEWFEKAASNKEPYGQAMLGRCYKEGWGTQRNLQLALLWAEKAANNNDPFGLYNLALLYRDGEGVERDDKRAVELLEKASQTDAFYALGWMAEFGRGCDMDLQKAITYYKRGEERHAEDALYSIGRIYEYGLGGIPKDLLKAKEWYRRSAELGYEIAQDKLETFAKDYKDLKEGI